MDLVTAFTGSGPAFVFRLIESYAAAGERLGLSAEEALKLATATFCGATALLADSGEKPGVQIGRAHVRTPVTNAHTVCRLLLENNHTYHNTDSDRTHKP